jgi:hypothetical protein
LRPPGAFTLRRSGETVYLRSVRTIGLPVDEPNGLPISVDGRALVVHETRSEPNRLHRAEVEVGLDLRCFLGPCDPEPIRRRQCVFFKAANRRVSSARLVVKKTSTSTPGFAPSFLPSGVAE